MLKRVKKINREMLPVFQLTSVIYVFWNQHLGAVTEKKQIKAWQLLLVLLNCIFCLI